MVCDAVAVAGRGLLMVCDAAAVAGRGFVMLCPMFIFSSSVLFWPHPALRGRLPQDL